MAAGVATRRALSGPVFDGLPPDAERRGVFRRGWAAPAGAGRRGRSPGERTRCPFAPSGDPRVRRSCGGARRRVPSSPAVAPTFRPPECREEIRGRGVALVATLGYSVRLSLKRHELFENRERDRKDVRGELGDPRSDRGRGESFDLIILSDSDALSRDEPSGESTA